VRVFGERKHGCEVFDFVFNLSACLCLGVNLFSYMLVCKILLNKTGVILCICTLMCVHVSLGLESHKTNKLFLFPSLSPQRLVKPRQQLKATWAMMMVVCYDGCAWKWRPKIWPIC
jgi:hypothetical protein